LKQNTFLLLVLFFSILSLQAQDEIGIVTAIQGTVTVNRDGQTISLQVGSSVFLNDEIRTESGAKAKILFEDDSLVVMGEEATLKFDEFILDTKNDYRKSRSGLFTGGLRVIVGRLFGAKDSGHEVYTETAIAGVKGTHYLIWVITKDETLVCVLEGIVYVKNILEEIEEIIEVKAGNCTRVFARRPPLKPRLSIQSEMQPLLEQTHLLDQIGAAVTIAPIREAMPPLPTDEPQVDVLGEEPLFEPPLEELPAPVTESLPITGSPVKETPAEPQVFEEPSVSEPAPLPKEEAPPPKEEAPPPHSEPPSK